MSTTRENEKRPMTLPEKILCHHAVGLKQADIKPGDMICVKVQWTLASEITWKSMDGTYNDMGRPRVWRNDRFWLAIDHTVDPRNIHEERPQALIKCAEDFVKEAGIKDFQEPNETILHTEFYRKRAQPGQVVVGADSHSCSTGGLGAFAIGLGAADVVMPLVTGETWIKVPETVLVEFTGTPPFGIAGKDAMLFTLRTLKANTVAVERCVEWSGNIGALSCDSRFAIANMSVEFGAIAGERACTECCCVYTFRCLPADEITAAYVGKRSSHNGEGLFFRADEGAQYAEWCEIPLADLEPQVALFPSPDNVVSVTSPEVAGMGLDGCFIGACTTAEEELILAALVLREGLRSGMRPAMQGKAGAGAKRRVTPGSREIIGRLHQLGLIAVYEEAGFVVGAPGCSYCLGIAADKAQEGEVWLSSQNRNYRNRMGKGSEANLASAVTVAASSFGMCVADPRPLLALVDQEAFVKMLDRAEPVPITISEPKPELAPSTAAAAAGGGGDAKGGEGEESSKRVCHAPPAASEPVAAAAAEAGGGTISGRVQVLGDNVDTDAILPGEYLHLNRPEDLGPVCFKHTNPNFRDRVAAGESIVVAGKGFGCGSSREQAVTALKGCGVQAVIARSFGYIFSRNYKNFSLLGIVMNEDRFYELAAAEGARVSVNLTGRTIEVESGGADGAAGATETFRFQMSLFEERLLSGGGIMPLFRKYGDRLFRVAVAGTGDEDPEGGGGCGGGGGGCSGGDSSSGVVNGPELQW